MQDLKGKVVVVTGAAGNLGRAVAAAFAARGSRLALIGRDNESLRRVIAELPAGTEAVPFPADLLSLESTRAAIQSVVERFGRIDVLANLIGGFAMGPRLHETPDSDWNLMMDLNARTLLNACRATIPHLMTSGGGRVVNVSARAALHGAARMGPYCAAKAAVLSLTETFADELKDSGIGFNCVLPGTLDTPQNRAAMPDQDPELWVALPALADVILFLASDASRAVTGAAIPVYGRS